MDTLLNTQTAVLLHLLRHKQVYGLGMIDGISADSRGLVNLHQGALYPCLKAMTDAGLLEQFQGHRGHGGGRPRNYYKLTPAGEALAEQHKQALLGLINGAPVSSVGADVTEPSKE